MLNNMSLKAKLIASFCTVALFLLLIGGINFYFLEKASKDYGYVSKVTLKNIETVNEMKYYSVATLRRMNAIAVEEFGEEVHAENEKRAWANFETFEKLQKDYESIPFVEGEEAVYKPVVEAFKSYKEHASKVIPLLRSPDAKKKAEGFKLIAAEVRGDYDKLAKAIDSLIDFHKKEAEARVKTAESTITTATTSSAISVLLGFAIALALGLTISGRLAGSLGSIISRIESGSTEVASAATQISGASTELSESSTEQASAIQQTAASVDQVTAMIKKNSENALQSQKNSADSKSAADQGKVAVQEMIHSIEEISESNASIMQQVNEGNKQIEEIVKVIAEIGNKTKVINDIVFQTKLLSFNASVEAARAGEHGKGFAVVAEEVGNLAQMSGNAAKEISGMLESSIQRVETIVRETKERVERQVANGKLKVETGTQTAQKCGEALENILKTVAQVDQMVAEIASASNEQAQGIGEINKAMNQLDQVTQQNTTVAQQSASAAEQLSAQSTELKGMVAELNTLLRGAGAMSAGPVMPVKTVSTARTAVKANPKNVTPISKAAEKRQKLESKMHAPAMKEVVGGTGIPEANDPRFEEV